MAGSRSLLVVLAVAEKLLQAARRRVWHLLEENRRLREKIEADPSAPVSLVTARGLGYKLVERG